MNQAQYLERHYDRLALRLSINDGLAKRLDFSGMPLPAIAVYQSSFGRDTLMPMTRRLTEAREGLRCLAMRWLLLADRKREVAQDVQPVEKTEQMELFA